MKNRKRDRHTLESDRKNNFGKLSSRDPWEKARERIRRPAYAPERLSFQARRLIRKPGCPEALQMVDECERFFRRDMKYYVNLDGERVIAALREKVYKEMGLCR